MKTRYIFLAALFILITFGTNLFAQQTQLRGSSFNMGYDTTASATNRVYSIVGQSFVGRANNENGEIESGFLPFVFEGASFTAIPIETAIEIPTTFELFQNYPNPFNPTTTIRYHLPKEAHTKIEIFNIRGQLLRTLVDQKQPVGFHSVIWDGKDNDGRDMSSGVYLYQMQAEDFTKVRKLTLIK